MYPAQVGCILHDLILLMNSAPLNLSYRTRPIHKVSLTWRTAKEQYDSITFSRRLKEDDSMKTDQKILEGLKNGDPTALQHIFDRYWDKLFIYSNTILQNEDASKDIVQTLFLELWEKRDRLFIRHLKYYLYQSVKHNTLAYLRQHRFDELDELIVGTLEAENNVERQLAYAETHRSIHNIINKLPHKCRQIFLLSRFENLTNEQIAARLNLSIRTVETQISNALKKLRQDIHKSF